MTHVYGCMRKREDARDWLFHAPQPYTGEFVDLSTGFPEPPYDQITLGSCVSQGTAATVDYALVKQGSKPLGRPSRLFIYYQGRVEGGYPIGQDTGLQVRDGLNVAAKDGVPPESDWPYVTSKFTVKPPAVAYSDAANHQALKYGSVQQGQIDAAIASGYVVVFGFDVYSSFESAAVAKTGIMPVPKRGEQQVGGHCVVACSTQIDGAEIGGIPGIMYRLCRNSWGLNWGIPARPGYYWMPASEMDGQDSSDFWVITQMEDPVIPVPPPTPTPTPADVDKTMAAASRAWIAAKGL